MFFLKLIFQAEDQLYVNFCFFILTVYRKYLLFQFFGWGLHMHVPILTGAQIGRFSG